MNQEGGIEKEKLSNDEIKQLIQRAINDGIDEAKYYLRLSEWTRPGSSFEDHGEIKVIYGEIDKIPIDHVYDYPTTNEYQYFIVPKTKAVVIIHKYGNDYDGEYVEHEDLYVFTAKDGWKRIPLS
jgi:hypothetical protein